MDVRVYGYTDNIVFIEWKKIEMEKNGKENGNRNGCTENGNK
jgi:hypothetical protein